jgi:hypothetical protein
MVMSLILLAESVIPQIEENEVWICKVGAGSRVGRVTVSYFAVKRNYKGEEHAWSWQRSGRYLYGVLMIHDSSRPARGNIRLSIRRVWVAGALVTGTIIAIACGREPTDPSRSDLTGLWKSFDRDLYIYNIEMEITQARPGVVIGKWRAQGRTDNRCTPGIPCTDSSIIRGRTEVAQVVLELLGAGTFVGEQPSTHQLKGIIRSEMQNFHVTFTRAGGN